MSRKNVLRIIAGAALLVGVLAVALWQFRGADSSQAAQEPRRTEPPAPAPASSTPPFVVTTPSTTPTATPTPSPTPEETPTPRPSSSSSARASSTPSASRSATKPSTSSSQPTQQDRPGRPPAPAPDIDEPEPTEQTTSSRPSPSDDAPAGIPGSISFSGVDLDDVCNRESQFTISWGESENATGYDVSVFGGSVSQEYRGPSTSMTVACPRVSGSVQVQGFAFNKDEESEYSYLTLTYSPPMDEQPEPSSTPAQSFAPGSPSAPDSPTATP